MNVKAANIAAIAVAAAISLTACSQHQFGGGGGIKTVIKGAHTVQTCARIPGQPRMCRPQQVVKLKDEATGRIEQVQVSRSQAKRCVKGATWAKCW